MNISDAGINFIKTAEALRLTAYQDGGGVWTIGYGHTGAVKKNQVCTQVEAECWLRADLLGVERCIKNCIVGELTQNQYDALCSFVYNIGCGAFTKSTLLHKLNEGDDIGAAEQFARWNHDNGVVVAILTRRREKETELFLA